MSRWRNILLRSAGVRIVERDDRITVVVPRWVDVDRVAEKVGDTSPKGKPVIVTQADD